MLIPPHFSPLLFSSLLLLSVPALLFFFPNLIHEALPLKNHCTVLSPPSMSSPLQPKIAFLFLTNTDLSFIPLWERFFQNNTNLFNIYIHLDPSAQVEKPLTGLFANRFVPAKPTQRASASLIAATKRLLAAALIDDSANEYFALLSQSCVPIRSFNFVYQSLVSNPQKRSFIEILSDEPQLRERYLARGEDVMLPEVPYDQFRVGSQFFVLSRRHAHLVVHDRRLWRKFRIPCLPTMEGFCYPEEHYFPTLLNIMDPQGCRGYTLTRVNWTDSTDGHPHTYTPAEITPQLIQELRWKESVSYLFARKFSKECLEPLMGIADDVIFHDK
ncbi:Core-2/I-Branching enzyme [Carex littledalei]|uniref:Core-2/I-Branching enzyme n=1 Tax=Carex littledalei TaxID=544730 RepID=A0A833R4V7_9POAL|nr:Core-2/I-Branching enzyme [Carex littledalei]